MADSPAVVDYSPSLLKLLTRSIISVVNMSGENWTNKKGKVWSKQR